MMSIVGAVATPKSCDVCDHLLRLHDDSGCGYARCDCWRWRRQAQTQAPPAAARPVVSSSTMGEIEPRLRIARIA
jgi:hypothetical protein